MVSFLCPRSSEWILLTTYHRFPTYAGAGKADSPSHLEHVKSATDLADDGTPNRGKEGDDDQNGGLFLTLS